MDDRVFIELSSLQGSNSGGQQQHSHSTTTLSIADDDMIDITPREQNYSPMADDSSSYDRPSSPTHSAFARQMNDPEGEILYWHCVKIYLQKISFNSYSQHSVLWNQHR